MDGQAQVDGQALLVSLVTRVRLELLVGLERQASQVTQA